MTRSNKISRRLVRTGLVLVTSLIVVTASAAADSTYSSGAYGSCQYSSCSITLSTSGTVNLNVTPTPSGSCTIQSDSAAVLTDNTNGYSLTATTTGTNTALVSGGNSINASSGTFASPTALSPSSWGYRVDGLGSFGAGPTTAQSNVSPSSTTFAGMPASNQTPVTLANTSAPADPAQTTTVWYGLCANLGPPNGTYSTQVTYTAVTN
jgi:hypothetical protein